MNHKVEEAKQLYKKGNFKQVLKLIENLAKDKNIKALELYVNSLFNLKKYKLALEYADELYKQDQFKGLLAKSKIFLKVIQPNKALESAKQAYGLKKDQNSIYALGAAEMQNKNYANIPRYVEELLSVGNKNAEAKAYYLQGLLSVINKRYATAKDLLIKANRLQPTLKVKSTLFAMYFSKNPFIYFLLVIFASGMIVVAPFQIAVISLVVISAFYAYFLRIYLQANNRAYILFASLIIIQLLLLPRPSSISKY